MSIKFRKPFRNPFVLLIYYVSIVLIAAYFLKTYRCNKTEFIKCTNCYSFKDQWNNIKNNSSVNKNAKILSCWLECNKSKPSLQCMFINKNKFGRFQYVDSICENDEIRLEFNGTGKNLENKISNSISTDDFMDKLDILSKNIHKIFKTPSDKYSLFVTAHHSNSIDKQSNAYYVDKNGILTKVAERDFPLKNVIYMNLQKIDEKDGSSENTCMIFK